MLERPGYKVTTRTSSIEALETYHNNPDAFDLIITDLSQTIKVNLLSPMVWFSYEECNGNE
jgi:CheY-like chemotaxis protein